MDKEQFLELISQAGVCEDEAQRREILTQLSEQSEKLFDTNSELETANKKYEADNENLRSANMKLFLRVGEQKSGQEYFKNSTGLEPEREKLKFEDLFNEKGMIK